MVEAGVAVVAVVNCSSSCASSGEVQKSLRVALAILVMAGKSSALVS